MKKNKGVISVLLSVIILASVIAIGAAGDVCSLAVANSYAQRINYMACESVLAEYNANLFKDYGLMGFDGGKNEVKDRIEKYTSMMRRANEKSKDEIVFFDVILNDMSMDCSGKSLCEKTVFMEQIREIVKLKAVENGVEMLMDAISGKQSINDEVAKGKADYGSKEQTSEGNEETEISIGEKNYDPEENDKDRVLRSKRIIDSLPSNADADTDAYKNEKFDFGDEDELLKLGEGSSTFLDKFYSSLSGGTDKFILIDYAYEYFKNAVKSTTDKKETFFGNEMEYLLKGNMSDNSNLSAVKRDLFLLRTALNLAHIYSDPEKCQIVLEAASAVSGPYAAALQFIFATAWAGVEASEDMERLLGGGKVSFIKSKQDWKTDIESIFSKSNMISSSYEGERGLDYTSYVKLFLLTCSKEKLMERMMDIIQINMKGRYDIQFDLRNHITGFSVSMDYERKAFLPKVLPGIVEDNLMHIEGAFSY